MEGKKSIGKAIVGLVPGFIAVIAGATVALVIYGKFLKHKVENPSGVKKSPIIGVKSPVAQKEAEGSDE